MAYELARRLTGHAGNFIVTAKIQGEAGEYEIKPEIFPKKREDGTLGIILELVRIASPKEQTDDGGNSGDCGEDGRSAARWKRRGREHEEQTSRTKGACGQGAL